MVRPGDPLFAEESEGAWAVGIKVTDAETWARVEKGELTGFSVAGLAKRTPVEFENTSEEGAMAEQVEKGLTQEATEPTGADVAEDLDAAADGFVSRVVAGLKRHFGGSEGDVEKAAAGEIKKESLGEVAFESVEKGFKEKMLHQQLWSITSALSDAVRDVLQDDEVKDKVAGVRTVVQEFQDWLEEQVGAAVSKEEGEGMTRAKRLIEGKGTEGEERQAAIVKDDHQDERLAPRCSRRWRTWRRGWRWSRSSIRGGKPTWVVMTPSRC